MKKTLTAILLGSMVALSGCQSWRDSTALDANIRQWKDPYPQMSDAEVHRRMEIISKDGLGSVDGFEADRTFWLTSREGHRYIKAMNDTFLYCDKNDTKAARDACWHDYMQEIKTELPAPKNMPFVGPRDTVYVQFQ